MKDPILFPKQGNPCWPLPPDYAALTEDGQRQARVNAVSLWKLPLPRSQTVLRGELAEASVFFFDRYYLWPDDEDDFNPLFYEDPPCDEAPFHRALWRKWATSRMTLDIAPRGSAKSRNVVKPCMVRALTGPWSYVYATSTHDNAQMVGQWFKDQFSENRRIRDDFGPEFPNGRIVPRRGVKPFSNSLLFLNNGSWIRMMSAETRARGGRPKTYILDDPEYDAKQSTDMEVLRAGMERLLFKIVLPMVQRSMDTGVNWTATFVSKRHYAWFAMQTSQLPDGTYRAADPRFNLWHRTVIRATWIDADGRERSCWPSMWPLNRAEKAKDPALSNRVSLEEIEEAIGTPIFNAEYRARPGEAEAIYFPPLTEDEHGYTLDKADGLPVNETQTTITYFSNAKKEKVTLPLRELVESGWLIQTCDTSWTAKAGSDSKASVVMLATSDNELFVLDLWSEVADEDKLVSNTFRMADFWLVPTIYPEVVQKSYHFFESLDTISRQRASEITGTAHLPRVVPIKGSTEPRAKVNRIAGLVRRFRHGLIKLPLARQWDPMWRRLFDQIVNFNPEAEQGGLQHDDELDCVSMSDIILKGKKSERYQSPAPVTDPLSQLTQGVTHDKYGNPLLQYVDFSKLPIDVLELIVQARADAPSRSREPV